MFASRLVYKRDRAYLVILTSLYIIMNITTLLLLSLIASSSAQWGYGPYGGYGGGMPLIHTLKL